MFIGLVEWEKGGPGDTGSGPTQSPLKDSQAGQTIHPQASVRVGDWQADVDEELAPLITELWQAGWETIRSCQEHVSGLVWIQFAWPDEGMSFLDAVVPFDPAAGSLWRRAKLWGFGQRGEVAEVIAANADDYAFRDQAWQYHVSVTDSSSSSHPESSLQKALAGAIRVDRACLEGLGAVWSEAGTASAPSESREGQLWRHSDLGRGGQSILCRARSRRLAETTEAPT